MPSDPPASEPPAADQQLRQRVVQMLTDDRAALLMGQPFLALLAMHLPIVPVVDKRVSTACTDGQRLFVSAPTMAELDAQQRRFVLAHLVWHCALLHPWRRAEREAPWWDLAIDHEVNAILEPYLEIPADAVLFEDRLGQSAELVYQSLVGRPCQGDRGRLADLHPMPGVAEGDADATRLVDPQFAPFFDRQTGRVWTERVLAVAQQAGRSGAPLPAAIEQLIHRLRHPQLPWRDLLRQFIVDTVGDRRAWLPPSRRHLHRGLYLPSRREQTIRLAVALDTSASTQAVQQLLLGELAGIVDSYGRYQLTLIQGDAQVQSVEHYSQDDPLDLASLKLKGFGGTDFRPVFLHVAEQALEPSALVFLTDGYGTAPDSPPDYPVLWVLTAEGRTPAPWGQLLRLPARREPELHANLPEG